MRTGSISVLALILFFLIGGSILGLVGLYVDAHPSCHAMGAPPEAVSVTCLDPAPVLFASGLLMFSAAALGVFTWRMSGMTKSPRSNNISENESRFGISGNRPQ
jgi:hypothetical protein